MNYPWVRCGHDFGPRPPGWGRRSTDWEAVRRELTRLRSLGLSVARWWILAGGVNVPAGADPATIAKRVSFPERRPLRRRLSRWLTGGERPQRWKLRAPLPPLPGPFLDDFAQLLGACRAANVRLLPSLMSFELFLPLRAQAKGVTSQGRGAFVLGRHRGAFFDATLEPLLDVSEGFRDQIAAWEVLNEPDWATAAIGAPLGGVAGHVQARAMAELLVDGARRIARRGLTATIGFSRADAPWLPAGARLALRRLAERGAYVHQLHHYPGPGGRLTLPPVTTSPIRPCWVGEMATSRAARWYDPELERTEDDRERYLEARLRLVAQRGYAGALLWARTADDPHVRWDERTEAQLRRAAADLT